MVQLDKSILRISKIVAIINGEPSNWIMAKYSLKQGDWLSPLLFILVSNALEYLLKTVARNKLFKAIGPREVTNNIHNIQITDDTLILYNANSKNTTTLEFILHSFELINVRHKNKL